MATIRKTKSVKTLLSIFEQSKTAFSVKELVKRVHQLMNKTTVYRVLDRLEGDGILHSFIGKDGLKWYALCDDGCSQFNHHDSHPHFQCKECGKTECLSIGVSAPSIPDYKIDSFELLLIGKCRACLS